MPLYIGKSKARELDRLLQRGPGGDVDGPKDTFRQRQYPPIIFHNTTTEEIPAYAILQPDGLEAPEVRPIIDVKKWDGNYPGPFLFNSHSPVLADENGQAQFGDTVRLFYGTGYTPASGDVVGPISGQWYCKKTSALSVVSIHGIYLADDLVAYGRHLPLSSSSFFVQAPSAGIPGRVATLLGKATCDVWHLNATTQTIVDSGINVEVLNWGVTAACATWDRYGWASYYDGAWWIISEDCADTGTSGAMSLTGGSPIEGDGDTGLSDSGSSGLMILSGQQPTIDDMASWGTSGDAPPLLP